MTMLDRWHSTPLPMRLLGGFAVVLAMSVVQSSFVYWTALQTNAADGRTDQMQHVLAGWSLGMMPHRRRA
jgi:hypothetical protein